jgi:release factor glutamine methyltransferase
VDASNEALAIATNNLNRYQLTKQVALLQGSWWDPLQPWFGSLELVVSNPPYIPTAVWRQLEPQVRDFEPALALDGGDDGLNAVRAIAAGACEGLAPGGVLLLEHHHDQSAAVLEVLDSAGLDQLQAHPDLEGVQRFASGRRPCTPCR